MNTRTSSPPPIASALLALLVAGCADLATEPDRVPESLTLAPRDTLITEGDEARLRIVVLDQDGQPFDGIPSWAPPDWSISDPSALTIGPDGTMNAHAGGEISVDAQVAGMSARTRVRINPSSVALTAPLVYLIQSTQNVDGDVPLVAGRTALLRVFVNGDRVSFYQPRARATFYQGDEVVHTAWLSPGSYKIPDAIDEGRLDRSFNATIPGEVLQPGVEMVVELDPDAVVPLAPGSGTRVPSQGRQALDVRALPPMEVTIVPVLLSRSPNQQVFNWTGGLRPESRDLQLARSVHPIGEFQVTVRDSYTTDADLTTESGWSAFLREITALRIAEGEEGYWYGATVLPPGSKYGGLGWVGYPASVGATSSSTYAHELGHNLSLRHAPCGGVSSFDTNFPHDGGSIGVWGYDFLGGSGLGALVDPAEWKDLMGYCSPRWVSDYHFKKALDFRLREEATIMARTSREGSVDRALLVWGSAGESELFLEPTFVVDAPPALPSEAGPWTVEGFDGDGARRFSLRFTPLEDSEGGRHFAFAVPAEGGLEEALDRIVLSGPGGTVIQDRSPGRRAALVTDQRTGRIQAIVRDWEPGRRVRAGLSLRLSEGLPVRGAEGGVR